MIGTIENYNEESQSGIIEYEEEQYAFNLAQWTSEEAPKTGDTVDFDEDEGQVTEVGIASAYLAKNTLKPVKKRWVACTLGLLLGLVGAHRFYLGYWGFGIAQIAVTLITGGYGVMWGLIEGVLIGTGHIYKDAKGRPLK